jgi:hypothetical protein
MKGNRSLVAIFLALSLAMLPSALAVEKTSTKAAGPSPTTVVNTILSGSGAPAKTLGINGDFYIDTKNLNLYGPKTKGVWKIATSLKVKDVPVVANVIGESGAIGQTGAKGATGDKGATSATGLQGIQGLTGPIGITGLAGASGSAGTSGTPGVAGAKGDSGCFRKEALLAVGGFDERFTRAQDWELNFRLRQSGGVIYFDPRLKVIYRPRSTVKALAKQYFEYGRWRRVVSRRHKGSINYRYLAPPFTVVATSLSILCGAVISPIFFIPALVYSVFILGASTIIGKSMGEILCLPTILLTMHISWGLGFLTSPKSLAPAVTLLP